MMIIRKKELKDLVSRLEKLSRDRSLLNRLISLTKSIGKASDIEGRIDIVLDEARKMTGADRAAIYYRIDGEIHYADSAGVRKKSVEPEDSLVTKIFQMPESRLPSSDQEEESSAEYGTVTVPLEAGSEIIGVIRLEGRPANIRKRIRKMFFEHAALMIWNESFPEQNSGKHSEACIEEDALSLLHSALDNLNDAVLIVDDKARFRSANREACRLLGYSRAELLTMGIPDLDPGFPEDRWPFLWEKLKMQRTFSIESSVINKEGLSIRVEITEFYLEYGSQSFLLVLLRQIARQNQSELDFPSHNGFLQNLDLINRIMLKTNNIEEMMYDLLSTLLSIFKCDRAWIANPCDPDISSFQISMECTGDDFSRTCPTCTDISVDSEVAAMLRKVRASDSPVRFGLRTDNPLPSLLIEDYNVHSQIAMALYPKGDTIYFFGLHQCTKPRIWTKEETVFFREVGRRLTECLDKLISYRNLQMSEKRFRARFEKAFDGLFVSTPEGRFADINRKGVELLGYSSKEDVLTLDISRDIYIDPLERKRFLAEVNEQGSGEKEIMVRKKNGERIIILVTLSAEKDETGSITAYNGTVRDITRQRQTEKELTKYREHLEELIKERTAQLKVSENMYRSLFTNMTVSFILSEIICDEKGEPIDLKLIEVNPAFERLMGLRKDELTGRRVTEMLPHFTPLIRFYSPVVYSGQPVHFETHSTLTERDYEVYSYMPAPRQCAVMITDITERIESEEHIRELNTALQNRALALEAANEELDAFAYSVSHDLRAPLRQIEGFIDLLSKRNKAFTDSKSTHYIEVISESAKRMGTMIDDLLSFSRMSCQEMNSNEVDLDCLLREVLKNMEYDTEGRNIKWSIAHLPVITGDRSMLRIVLINLISNALKFTKTRTQAEIEIGFTHVDDEELVFFVRDNGVGFDMDYADSLFGVFQRLHRKEDFDGTGIGLANTRSIIKRHGGRTWAESEVDCGATFYFSLPYCGSLSVEAMM